MTPDFHFRRAALFSALAAIYPAISCGAGAARIDFASGVVTAQQGPDSSRRSLARGAEVFPGDTITTNDGMAQLRFTDGARVSLKPGSEFRIDDYRFNGKADGEEKSFFSLIKGGLRTITGLVGRTSRENYRVKTAVATIGIRGTEYSVSYGNSINVNTAEGVVEVCNSQGCLLLYPGDEGYVKQDSTPPVLVQTGEEKPKKDDTPPELSDIEAPGNDREVNGNIANLGGFLTGTKNYRVAWGHTESTFSSSTSALSDPGQQGIIDGNGILQGFTSGTSGFAPSGVNGSASVETLGNDGVVAWGRWVGTTPATMTLFGSTASEGYLHYVAGLPTPSSDPAVPPSASFSLLGGSVSGSASGNGSLTSGSMNVTFGSNVVNSLDLGMTVGANTYSVSDSSISISTANGQLEFASSTAITTGSGCSGTCSTTLNGVFYGSGAARAGVSFSFDALLVSESISGAAALKR
jgi:hypothetical protein